MVDQNHLEARDLGMPGIGTEKLSGKTTLQSYAVKYLKGDVDDAGDMLQIQAIETRALRSTPGDEDVVLVSEDKFTFMDKYFIIIKYLEKV